MTTHRRGRFSGAEGHFSAVRQGRSDATFHPGPARKDEEKNTNKRPSASVSRSPRRGREGFEQLGLRYWVPALIGRYAEVFDNSVDQLMEIRVNKKVDDRDDSQADGGRRAARPFATVCRAEAGRSVVGRAV